MGSRLRLLGGVTVASPYYSRWSEIFIYGVGTLTLATVSSAFVIMLGGPTKSPVRCEIFIVSID
jgi:hypothetical protein